MSRPVGPPRMKPAMLAGAVLLAAAAACPATAADDDAISRMALCRDSWFEWHKSAPARFVQFALHVRAHADPHGNDPYLVPRSAISVAGFKVIEVFPQSVGMGVGFSLTLEAGFDETRKAMEKDLGQPLQHCETSDNMHSCELRIAEQRTFMLMSGDDPKSKRTLIGCYYFYEK